jgi:hypothetical protein
MNGMREKERGVEAKLKFKTLERKKNSDVTTKKILTSHHVTSSRKCHLNILEFDFFDEKQNNLDLF